MIAARPDAPHLLVFEASGVADIDYTAARMLSETVSACRGMGIGFSIARLESVRAQDALARFGLDVEIGADNIFRSADNAVAALAHAAVSRQEQR